jgi:hypothetical protein
MSDGAKYGRRGQMVAGHRKDFSRDGGLGSPQNLAQE